MSIRIIACDSYLPDYHVPELWWEREDTEEIDLTQGGFQETVVGRHGIVGAVVMASNSAKLSHLQAKLDEIA